MKYLVFGSSGFVGKSLVKYLRSKGEEVIGVQRKDAEKYNIDITRAESFEKLKDIDKVDLIINCASVLPDGTKKINDVDYLQLLYKTNVLGAVNILNFAASNSIKKVINCSTLVVNNKPWPTPLHENFISYPTGVHTGYASSKLSQEIVMNEVAAQLDIQLIHLRLSALYGESMKWQGILPSLIDKALAGEKIFLSNANKVSFDFLYIDDLVSILHQLCKLQVWKHQTINTASGEEIYLKELAEKIKQLVSSSATIEYSENDQPVSRSQVDVSLLKEMIGHDFNITPIEKGIQRVLKDRINTKECVI